MTTLTDIHMACIEAKGYHTLAKNLSALGIRSYTVDVASETVLCRLPDGDYFVHQGNNMLRHIGNYFNEVAMMKALRDTQQGKTDYLAFLDDIARAGIRMFETTLDGERKRVAYFGVGGYYEEEICV